MQAFSSIDRHPLVAFTVTVVLAIASMALMLWLDHAAQATDNPQLTDLVAWLEE